MYLSRIAPALLALVAASPTLHADTLDVPGTYATIQAAIVAATPGDTVLVAPGTYVETIDFLGKAITVESSGGAIVTIIDADSTGPVATFETSEANDSVLRGFTLTGGIGSQWGLPRGGGVLILEAGPTIEQCVITSNGSDYGGGVWSEDNLPAMPARLIDCEISENTARRGGGFGVVRGALYVERCTIADNISLLDGAGGAAYNGSYLDILNSFVTGNWSQLGRGGGLWLYTGSFDITANVSNCVIADNVAALEGGGIYRDVFGTTTFCTITNNSGQSGGGLNSATPSVGHCIIWGNTGGEIGGTTAAVFYCNVRGGYPGSGNIDVDPLFVDAPNGDYHLAPTSACQDAGNPTDPGVGTDCDGDPRLSGVAVDIGADEATFPKSPWTFRGHALAGSSGTPNIVGTGTALPSTPTTVTLTGTTPSSPTTLVLGASHLGVPFKGGVMVPDVDILIGGLLTDGTGALLVNGSWPPAIPSGFTSYMQFWMNDASGPLGFVASNGLSVTAP
jgi:hypothetical protein